MLAAWARSNEKYVEAQLLKLNFEDSRNKGHSLESCWCATASVRQKILFQNT